MNILELHEIHGGYGETEVLHGIDLRVGQGEIVSIIGPNGAGKSTLLKAIMGYLPQISGSVMLAGQEISHLRPDQRVAQGIAYVPQLENVFPSLTVEENMRMGGYLLPRKERSRRAEFQYQTFPTIAERRKQRVDSMSGGERQMLAMARALMMEPNVLLLDEPSAAMSPKMAEQVFDIVCDINRQGRAVVLVEQEAHRSLQISERGYVLADGRNAFEGPAYRMLKDEKLREAFLGSE